MNDQKVIEYYDYTIPFYKVFWHKGTNALHYGLWDETTKSLPEALLNTNKVVSDLAAIKTTDKVLDAGCGIGGTSIWIAKNTGAHVIGITVSDKQKLKAEKYAREAGVEKSTEFYVRDFITTGFSDESFDVVIGIESVCHAENKSDFLKEAYRILKPEGRIVIADGFLRREPAGEEVAMYQDFLKGFALDNLAKIDDFLKSMTDLGFKDVRMMDKTNEIAKTSDHMFKLSTNWIWVNKTLYSLGLIPKLMVDNMRTGIVQRDFFKEPGIYAIFYGRK